MANNEITMEHEILEAYKQKILKLQSREEIEIEMVRIRDKAREYRNKEIMLHNEFERRFLAG